MKHWHLIVALLVVAVIGYYLYSSALETGKAAGYLAGKGAGL